MRFGMRSFLRVNALDAGKGLKGASKLNLVLPANRPAIPLLAGIEFENSLLSERDIHTVRLT